MEGLDRPARIILLCSNLSRRCEDEWWGWLRSHWQRYAAPCGGAIDDRAGEGEPSATMAETQYSLLLPGQSGKVNSPRGTTGGSGDQS
jgi:hypothetical protein